MKNIVNLHWQSEETRANIHRNEPWTEKEKVAFRIAFIFFTIMSIPTDYGYYVMLGHFDWLNLNYRQLTEMAAFFNPQFLNVYSESGFFGVASYINWPFVLLIAVVGALIWGYFDKHRPSYNDLYYLVRVFARYRVAYAGISWGYKKIFVMQMPVQFEAIWNTELINFFAKRLYWEVLSVAPVYEVYLGCAEFFAGFLLLFRRTTTLGAALAFAVFGNIAISNHAYDIGEQVPSALMAVLALFILWKDIPAIYQVIVREKNTILKHYNPTFGKAWQRWVRTGLKVVFNFLLVALFAYYEVRAVVQNDFYKIPNTPGLEDTKGVYEVRTFKRNGTGLPHNPLDTARWQDVIFENWSSIGVKYVNKPQQIAMFAAGSYPRVNEPYDGKLHFDWRGDFRRYHLDADGKKLPAKVKWPRDVNIDWEFAGMQGRVFYYYEADTVNNVLKLVNKNRYHRDEKMTFTYEQPDKQTIILKGLDDQKDSIYVELKKSTYQQPLLSVNR
ncbi:hypothetical protein [Sphingobacterium corticibacterium]|uniref:DoxX family protein n=1 Tax=Sphingobacterium corticibacterium TaxID=2484746 RepID=A0A4Q6XPJ5_9SPHI|nr:hypothetical protein [Sphingobacterium corticibacterium]RZF58347.1 hypothetical protein EWE74_17180 [Sphingobacterium corticibacterium]